MKKNSLLLILCLIGLSLVVEGCSSDTTQGHQQTTVDQSSQAAQTIQPTKQQQKAEKTE